MNAPTQRPLAALAVITVMLAAASGGLAQDKREAEAARVVPIAIFPFQERGREAADLSGKVTDLLFANLIQHPKLFLVEREDLAKILQEQELNRSGLVDSQRTIEIGRLTGAKVLLTGSILQVGESQYLVGKIISAETGRVLGASAKGGLDDDLDALVQELSSKIAETIAEREDDLIADARPKTDIAAALKRKLGDAPRPSVYIDLPERHIGQPTSDPAAATELAYFCHQLGFEVVDAKAGGKSKADVVIVGEAFSEFAARHGNLVSVKSRLEVKAVARKSGRLLAVDRQTTIGVGLAELVAAKTALQEASAKVAERLLPQIAEADPK